MKGPLSKKTKHHSRSERHEKRFGNLFVEQMFLTGKATVLTQLAKKNMYLGIMMSFLSRIKADEEKRMKAKQPPRWYRVT